MNELNATDSGGIQNKAADLLNSKTFSDIRIEVTDGTQSVSFNAHKLFLAMNSEEFAKIFYRSSTSPKVHKIHKFKPRIVYMMLEFIYKNQTDLSNLEESRNLYDLAEEYEIGDLKRYCLKYLVRENVTLENIFDKYEFALSKNIQQIIKACRNVASTETMKVINSPRFKDAPMSVVEDILQLDTMSIMSELDLIEAAIKWAKEETVRRGAHTENLRICVYPLFKHLRFLTLTASEFCHLVEENENLINPHESSVLTMAIIQPDVFYRLPSGFNSNNNPRKSLQSTLEETDLLILKTANTSISSTTKKPWSFDTDLQEHLRDNFGLSATKQEASSKPFKSIENSKISSQSKDYIPVRQDNSNSVNLNSNVAFPKFGLNTANSRDSSSKSVKFSDSLSQIKQLEQNSTLVKINENIDTFSKFNSQNVGINQNSTKPSTAYSRSDSVPNYRTGPPATIVKKQAPILRVNPSPQLSVNKRTFNFPLFDFDKCVSSAFTTDIKCSSKITVNRGGIEIYGVELKMKQRAPEEVITAYFTLNGSSIPSLSKTCEEKLKNNALTMMFGEPVKLYENNHLIVDVVVEDLILNRCSGCRDKKCELNSNGLNISADILMKSNQTNNDTGDFYYLFSRLIFKPLA